MLGAWASGRVGVVWLDTPLLHALGTVGEVWAGLRRLPCAGSAAAAVGSMPRSARAELQSRLMAWHALPRPFHQRATCWGGTKPTSIQL